MSKRKRTKRRRPTNRKGECTTPTKVAYRDKTTADRFAEGRRSYLCECGAWHLTTQLHRPR